MGITTVTKTLGIIGIRSFTRQNERDSIKTAKKLFCVMAECDFDTSCLYVWTSFTNRGIKRKIGPFVNKALLEMMYFFIYYSKYILKFLKTCRI